MDFNYHREKLRKLEIRFPQSNQEFAWMCDKLAAHKCNNVLEIGTRDGGSLYMLAQYVPLDCKIISIDLPGAKWGRAGSGDNRNRVADELRSQGRTVVLIDGDSTADSTVADLDRELDGALLDFVFIDGDHRFAGVLRDWELYSQRVQDGGLIAFHDIDDAPHLPVQVAYVWNVLTKFYKSDQIIANPGKGYGIGILEHLHGVDSWVE